MLDVILFYIIFMLVVYVAYAMGHYLGYRAKERELGLPEYDHSDEQFP